MSGEIEVGGMHWVRDRRDRWISDLDDAAFATEAAMLDEIERLRAILATVSEEREVYRNAQMSTESGYHAERALADQLADALGNEWPGISNKPYSDVSTAHAATTAALAAWQERRNISRSDAGEASKTTKTTKKEGD